MPDMKKASAANRGPSKNTNADTNDTLGGTEGASIDGALATARHLAEHGVPLFLAEPAMKGGKWNPTGGHSKTGYVFPPGWQRTEADPSVVDRWRPGMALCAVMGHAVDGFDVDPGKGGGDSAEEMELLGLVPRSYGRASTPSGGTHDLIAPLRVGSHDGVRPGVDLKGGRSDGEGRGFLFIAPTRKASKLTGKVGQYRWTTPPNLDALDPSDSTGAGLAAMAAAPGLSEAVESPSESLAAPGAGWGTPYADLSPRRQELARQKVERVTEGFRARFAEAEDWDVEAKDHKARGWEKLCADAAFTLAQLALAPWAPFTKEDAAEAYDRIIPEIVAASVPNKLDRGRYRRAAGKPLPPPWDDPEWSTPESDFDVLPGPDPVIVAPLPGLDLDMLRAAEEAVFGATPTLGQVRQLALARMVSPWAVLSAALARVLAETPVGVVLPAVISSQAVLNLAVAVVGGSGIGKTGGMNVAGELLDTPPAGQDASPKLAHRILLGDQPKQTGAGSGEGLIQSFLKWVKPEGAKRGWFELADHPHVLMRVDEVGQIAAVQGRNGSTLASVFRSALTGDPLQTTNATADRLRDVPAKKYRFCAVVGVQPELSDALLNEKDAAGGTPQRLLWSLAAYPWMPEDTPDDPGGIGWVSPWPPGSAGEVAVPAEAVSLIRSEQIAKHRGTRSNLDGHALLTRLRVGAALAMLHGERDITSEWWLMAGELIRVSDAVRTGCSRTLARHAMEQAAQRGRQQAKTDQARDDDLRQEAVKRSDVWAKAMWRLVYQHETQEEASNRKHKKGEGCTSRCLNYSLRNHRKSGAESDAVLADAVERDWLAEAGGRVHLGQECPEEEVEE